jgi:hypothetical protein
MIVHTDPKGMVNKEREFFKQEVLPIIGKYLFLGFQKKEPRPT